MSHEFYLGDITLSEPLSFSLDAQTYQNRETWSGRKHFSCSRTRSVFLSVSSVIVFLLQDEEVEDTLFHTHTFTRHCFRMCSAACTRPPKEGAARRADEKYRRWLSIQPRIKRNFMPSSLGRRRFRCERTSRRVYEKIHSLFVSFVCLSILFTAHQRATLARTMQERPKYFRHRRRQERRSFSRSVLKMRSFDPSR